jgi:hypothetical protein
MVRRTDVRDEKRTKSDVTLIDLERVIGTNTIYNGAEKK